MNTEYQKKYLKYKTKYLNMIYKLNNQIGGSYSITSDGRINEIISYPEVSFIIDVRLGMGGSGAVTKAIIKECPINPSLIGKQVAIKNFGENYGNSRDPADLAKSEAANLISYLLDKEGELVTITNIPSLLFNIKTGPLANNLVYEYGGLELRYLLQDEKNYTIDNIKLILIDLFKILRKLSLEHDNIHNDIKQENIVYDINEQGLISVNLIDFGSSRRRSELESGKDNFIKRTNINSPETIKNHLKLSSTNNFSRWYYYPFISIMFFLLTGIEYSTGSSRHTLISKLVTLNDKTYKKDMLEIILENKFIKSELSKRITSKFRSVERLIEKINNIIDLMCKEYPIERASEDDVIRLLGEL
jgi:serine/threonine protein kinase